MYNVVKSFLGDRGNEEYRCWAKSAYEVLNAMYGEHSHILGNLATHQVSDKTLELLASWGMDLAKCYRVTTGAWDSWSQYSHYCVQLHDTSYGYPSTCYMQLGYSFKSEVDAVYFKLAMS